jgi:hypothetical protein
VTTWLIDASGGQFYTGNSVYIGSNNDSSVSMFEVEGGISVFGIQFGGANGNFTQGILFNDNDDAIYHHGANVIAFRVNGSNRMLVEDGYVRHASGGWALMNETPSSTNPTLTPGDGDPDTGVGKRTTDIGTLIAGGVASLDFGSDGVTVYERGNFESGLSVYGEFVDTNGVSQFQIDVNGAHVKTPTLGTMVVNKAYADNITADLTAHTNAGEISGTSLAVNAKTVSIGGTLQPGTSGASVFMTVPFSMTMTGASLICFMSSPGGASVFNGGTGFPATDGTNDLLDISGTGSSVYNLTDTSSITAGDILLFDMASSHPYTAGASLWTIQLHGTRN